MRRILKFDWMGSGAVLVYLVTTGVLIAMTAQTVDAQWRVDVQKVDAGDNANNWYTEESVRELLCIVTKAGPWTVDIDKDGTIISLGIPSKYQDEQWLERISYIDTIRELAIVGFGIYEKADTPMLTERGIAALAPLENLASLRFTCLNHIDDGAMSGLTKLKLFEGKTSNLLQVNML